MSGQPTELRSTATGKAIRVLLYRLLPLGRLGIVVLLRDDPPEQNGSLRRGGAD